MSRRGPPESPRQTVGLTTQSIVSTHPTCAHQPRSDVGFSKVVPPVWREPGDGAACGFRLPCCFRAQLVDPASIGWEPQQQIGKTKASGLGLRRPRNGRPVRSGRTCRVAPTPRPSTSAVAKFARPINDRADSQLRPPGQPPTLGGLKRSCPRRAAQSASTSVLGGGSSNSRARTAPTMYSMGDSTRVPRLDDAKNARERSTVATAQPTSSWCDRRPSASALISGFVTAFPHEQVADSPCQPIGRGRLLEDDPHHVGAAPLPGLAENRFGSLIVPRRGFASFAVDDVPAGQGPGGLPHVIFGVMTDAQAEQLQELAGQVFVGMALAVGRRVEPDQEGGIAHRGFEQRSKRLRGPACGRGRSGAAWPRGR